MIDGDSLLAVVEGKQLEIRMAGINAPERDECYGPEAAMHLTELTSRPTTVARSGFDQFDRVLATLLVNGVSVNETLVVDGYALGEVYPEAEIEAEELDLGMWGACRSKHAVSIDGVNADPPGPDNDVLNQETVSLTNRGENTIDLADWTLRDYSSRHRFHFPDTELAPAETITVASGCEPRSRTLAWCSSEPVWNNQGDHVILLDDLGLIVDHLRY